MERKKINIKIHKTPKAIENFTKLYNVKPQLSLRIYGPMFRLVVVTIGDDTTHKMSQSYSCRLISLLTLFHHEHHTWAAGQSEPSTLYTASESPQFSYPEIKWSNLQISQGHTKQIIWSLASMERSV